MTDDDNNTNITNKTTPSVDHLNRIEAPVGKHYLKEHPLMAIVVDSDSNMIMIIVAVAAAAVIEDRMIIVTVVPVMATVKVITEGVAAVVVETEADVATIVEIEIMMIAEGTTAIGDRSPKKINKIKINKK